MEPKDCVLAWARSYGDTAENAPSRHEFIYVQHQITNSLNDLTFSEGTA